jgi:hypothetical protein
MFHSILTTNSDYFPPQHQSLLITHNRFARLEHCPSRYPTVLDIGLRSLACWDCGFESRGKHGCLSLVSVVCCQAQISAIGRSLVQGNPTESITECEQASTPTISRYTGVRNTKERERKTLTFIESFEHQRSRLPCGLTRRSAAG